MQPRSIPAGEFKAQCLRLMDEVQATHRPLLITKHGRPVAKLVPVDDTPVALHGFMAGSVLGHGDLIAGTGEVWDADA